MPLLQNHDYVDVAGIRYALGTTGAGRHMGVSAHRCDMWYQRRAINGFPESVMIRIGRYDRRIFDPDELDRWLDAWYLTHVASRPPGWRPRMNEPGSG